MKQRNYLLVLTLISFSILSGIININQQNSYLREINIDNLNPLTSDATTIFSFTYGAVARLRDLDPVDARNKTSINVLDQILEPLYRYDLTKPNLPLIPALAHPTLPLTWSIDNLNLTIPLRQGVRFHDGTPFNATAVKFSIDRYQYFMNATGAIMNEDDLANTAELYRWFAEYDYQLIINHTEIIDTYTIKITLNRPFASFLDLLSFTSMYIISPTSHAAQATTRILETEYIVGTGPYKFVSYDPGVEVRFQAFENYWKGPAHIKSLIFFIIPDPIARFQALLNGDVDMIDRIEDMLFLDISPTDLLTLKAHPDIIVLESNKTSAKINFIVMNNKQINNTMRKAISYAIDYDNITQGIMQDTVERLKSAIPNGILYANDSFDYPTYNVTKARQILLDGGVVSGLDPFNDTQWTNLVDYSNPIAEYNYIFNTDNQIRESIGLLLEYDLERIGLKVNLVNMSFNTFLLTMYGSPPYSKDDFDLLFFHWIPDYNDPSNYINYLYSITSIYDYAQVNDTSLNQWMQEGLEETDPIARGAKYDEVQQYIIEDLMPMAYTYVQKLYCAHHRNLTGFQQNIFNKLNFHEYQWEGKPFKPSEPFIPGYNVYILIGLFGIASIWLIRKARFKTK